LIYLQRSKFSGGISKKPAEVSPQHQPDKLEIQNDADEGCIQLNCLENANLSPIQNQERSENILNDIQMKEIRQAITQTTKVWY